MKISNPKPFFLLTFILITTGLHAAELSREAWTTSRIEGSPEPPKPYVVEQVFQQLKFENVVEMVPMDGRLYVYTRWGKIWSFPEVDNPNKAHLFGDLELRKTFGHGFGMAFHPQWKKHPYIFLTYMTRSLAGENRLSRFKFTMKSGLPTMDHDSEEVIISWRSGGHYGGNIQFGPRDGMLYLSTGDATPPNPPDSLNTGQDNSDILSCVLRLDINKFEKGQKYSIPPDNPFIDHNNVRPEIWAFGFRQPWKMSFDNDGRLWVGEVGWELWEMIHLVERGGNYGWSAMEATNPIKPGLASKLAPITPPIAAHPHTEAASITGGFVYEGTRLKGLQGAYVYADYETGIFWSIRHDGEKLTEHDLIADSALKISTFGLGNRGELYFVDYGEESKIYRLIPNPRAGQVSQFPTKLSDTGLFDCVATEKPAAGVYEFGIHEPMWEDGAVAARYIALPGKSSIETEYHYRDNGSYRVTTTWPTNAVLARTVRLEETPVETQVLHFDGDAWAGYSYRWNQSGTDAELVGAEGVEFDVPSDLWKGGDRYRIASRAECMRCHNTWNKFTPAFEPMQLSDFPQIPKQPPREVATQLGLTNSLFFHKDEGKGKLVNSRGRKGSLETKARSWLHANCSHCHRRHGGGTAPLELNFDRNLSESATLWQAPTRGDFGLHNAKALVPGQPWRSVLNYRVSSIGHGHMPPLGSREVDEHGAQLLWNWVAKLPVENPVKSGPGSLEDVSSAMQLSQRVAKMNPEEDERQQLIQQGLFSKDHNIRSLFERFRLPEERPIPTALNPTRLLGLSGDLHNGKLLLSPTGKLAGCFACHKIGDHAVGFLGPDLKGVGKRLNRSQLLESLLKPSATIVPEYRLWTIGLKTGESYSGFVDPQEGNSLTLRLPTGQLQKINPDQVRFRKAQPLSLMPEGLLNLLSEQEVADLLAYLESMR